MGHEAEYPYIYKENADIYLNALARAIYERYGDISVKMLIVGGMAVILKHGFRDSSEDIDGVFENMQDFSEEIESVAQEFSITHDWLNSDFTKTKSYTPKLMRNAEYLCSYGSVLHIYVVCDLDLICMKLTSMRDKDYNDLDSLFANSPYLTEQLLLDRLTYLYGGVEILSDRARLYVTSKHLPKY